MNREQRRAAAKQMKKDGTEEVAEKVALFGKLGDECLVCAKAFRQEKQRDGYVLVCRCPREGRESKLVLP